ncbi:hypothetical protein GGE24_001223 [Bradyrhizobium centrosematis]|nr:hypothetical protein [Bradyrhizobium centrosematis]MCS3771911.1 hypothetical protein [Bradyrhizobium centrosematis]
MRGSGAVIESGCATRRGAVRWTKAQSALPTCPTTVRKVVDTLRFAHLRDRACGRQLELRTWLLVLAACSPELCFVAPPSNPRGHREGRVPTDTRGPLRELHAHAENRTAAYRWCRSLGLPCTMVGRLMPRSPGSRTFLWPPLPFELTMPSTRLGSRASSNRLDRSNDGQDHTVLPYARPALSPQYFQPRRRSYETYRRDEA